MVKSIRMRAHTLVNTLVSTVNRTILTNAWLLNGPNSVFRLVSCRCHEELQSVHNLRTTRHLFTWKSIAVAINKSVTVFPASQVLKYSISYRGDWMRRWKPHQPKDLQRPSNNILLGYECLLSWAEVKVAWDLRAHIDTASKTCYSIESRELRMRWTLSRMNKVRAV
jgi:hypothetical protein